MKSYILGISCFYHDSAAAIIKNGEIIAAAQEERFTRKKHDSSFPENAINYCLKYENINLSDIKAVVYYEKPFLTFERLLETYISVSPRGVRSFIAAMQIWIKEKLFLKYELKKRLQKVHHKLTKNVPYKQPKLLFSEHHQSHAAAAFYPSNFNNAAILCMDGVGEWATTSAWVGENNKITKLWEINFPHSIGLLYSAFTYYCGFKVNSGEYKLMGLAPYGEPIFAEKIKNNLIDIKKDGSYRLRMDYFKYHRGFRMTSNKFHNLFGEPPRNKEKEIKQFHMDIAASIQSVTEEIVVKLARSLKKETNLTNLCLSGGVALNCVANGELQRKGIFDEIWIQPASGDAGSALGAAYLGWHDYFEKDINISTSDKMKGTYLGPDFSNKEIVNYLEEINATFESLNDEDLFKKVAYLISKGKVIGWFNGRMEFGPRALGARSIIGDPRNKKMQSLMNLKIKYRESFRPFAPSILQEELKRYFDINTDSPYMLLVAPIKEEFKIKLTEKQSNLFGIEKLNIPRSSLPAITHIDYSSRIQTVNKKTNPRYHNLIKKFMDLTGCPLVINTSFNVRGEPIVCNPQDAYRCFMRTEMDVLVLQNQILMKNDQFNKKIDEKWMQEFELD